MKILSGIIFFVLLISFSVTGENLIQSSENGKPGETVRFVYLSEEPLKSFTVFLKDDEEKIKSQSRGFLCPFEEDSILTVCYLGLPSTLKKGNYFLDIEAVSAEGSVLFHKPFSIEARDFIFEQIHLDMDMSELRTTDDPRRFEESRQLGELLYTFHADSVYHHGFFCLPVSDCPESSHFGDRREFIYNDNESAGSIHNGVDLAACIGTEVHACAKGKVVLIRERLITGNTLVLEHLPGIYSLYFHLDSIDTEEGKIVNAGEIIGTVGNTGLATGPHLHWEVRVSGIPVDPYLFINKRILDKDEIFTMIDKERNQEGG